MSEPFGLLPLLQSLLSQPPQEAAKNDSFTPQNTPVLPEGDDAPVEGETQSSQKAFLSFMETHDKRAKRIKK